MKNLVARPETCRKAKKAVSKKDNDLYWAIEYVEKFQKITKDHYKCDWQNKEDCRVKS